MHLCWNIIINIDTATVCILCGDSTTLHLACVSDQMWSCPSGHNWRTIRPHATHYENKTLANVVQPQLKDNSTTHDITMAILLSTIGGQFDHRRQCRGQCFCSVHLSITPQYTSVHLSTPRHSSAPLSTTAQICCSFTCERAQSWQNADVSGRI